MPDLSKLEWGQIVTVVAALLALMGTLTAARIARSGDRAIRARIAKDLSTWEKLPVGSQPRKEMFDLIGQQVHALAAPRDREVAALRTARRYFLRFLAWGFGWFALYTLYVIGYDANGDFMGFAVLPRGWWLTTAVVVVTTILYIALFLISSWYLVACLVFLWPALRTRAARRRIGR